METNRVSFDDDNQKLVGNARVVSGKPTGITAWLVKMQIAKNANQAEQFLIVIAIGALLLAGVICFLNFWHLPNPNADTPLGRPIVTAPSK